MSEVVEHFQWLTEEQSRNLPADKLAEVREEIGDVMIYLTGCVGGWLCTALVESKVFTSGPERTRTPNPKQSRG